MALGLDIDYRKLLDWANARGKLVLEVNGGRHELAEGDVIVFGADVPHAYVNPASEECWMHLVMTYA
jgi:quercetin dioxygenase-like cupin family protein